LRARGETSPAGQSDGQKFAFTGEIVGATEKGRASQVEEKVMDRYFRIAVSASLFALLLLGCGLPAALAQDRMSDKDVGHLMKNLSQDAKAFSTVFKSAVGKSSIRKTHQEKDAKTMVNNFVNQTKGMANQFQQTKRGEPALTLVRGSAAQIEGFMQRVLLGSTADNSWSKVRADMDFLTKVFPLPAVAQP
jgi:hypothetical protein